MTIDQTESVTQAEQPVADLRYPGLEPYQLRVVQEAEELGARMQKLGAFLMSAAAQDLITTNPRDAELLRHQAAVMSEYHRVLRARISHFAPRLNG